MMLGFVAFWTGIALVAYIVIVLILLILHEMQIEKPLLTTGLLFVVILLLVYIGRRSLFAAVELSVATILFVIVLGVFKSSLLSDQKKKIEALLMDRNILDNAKKTLTSGAAMLSVISCYTTACGMHDVVFGGWLAYPASIAVQVTLAFLSFFLLRFVLSVRNLNWPRIAEKVVSYVLILVAAGYLTISSLFSYSFIATKAYERTKNENNEAIARTYFIETVNLLESENEQRGTALYSELSGAINDSNGLSLAIQIQQAVENEQLNAQIISALAGVSNMSVTVTIEQDDDLNDVPEYALTQSAKNTLIQSNSILRGWIGKLTTALSDLNAHILLLNQNWADRNVETFLVTDKPTDRTFENVTVVAAGEGTEITERLKAVLPLIKTEYVLFTLDDYFLTERISTQAINEDIQIMKKYQIDYLRLFVMTMKSLRNRKAEELEPGIFLLDNHAGDYIVSLYAGIWRKDFMEKTLTKKLNAWQYEVALTNMARQLNARCADSRRGEFPILDVIRKGKVLTKARKYFDGNPIYKGDREDMRVKDEWMLEFRTWLREWLPKPLFNLSKAIMRRRGYTFFSDNQ